MFRSIGASRRLVALVLVSAVALLPAVACDTASHRYLYVVEAPFDRDGFRQLKPSIEVYDIANGHRLVRTIPLPSDVMQVRGVAGNATTHTLYISHFGRY